MLAGLTVEQLAAKTGVTANSIYDWERGETKPSAKNFAKLAKACGCSTNEIIELYE